jgi:hypothetical protein
MEPNTNTPPPTPTPTPAPPNPSGQPPQATVFESHDATQQPSNQPLEFGVKKRKLSKLKLPLIILAILLVLGGISSAAYYGYILPSKPENKVLTALANTASQKQVTINGKVDAQNKDTNNETQNTTFDFVLKADLNKNDMELSGTVGAYGAQFPYDIRYIEKSVYFKIGGLSSVSKFSSMLGNSPELKTYLDAIAKVNDQWYVIDRSLINQSKEASCISSIQFSLTKDDTNKLKAAYKKYPLFKVKSSSADTVDGVKVTKMELDPASDEVAASFAKELDSLSFVEEINKCVKTSNSAQADTQINQLYEDAKGTLTVYITKDELVKKIEVNAADSKTSSKTSLTFDYKSVTLEKPNGAKPIQDLLADLMGPIYSSLQSVPQTTPKLPDSVLQ